MPTYRILTNGSDDLRAIKIGFSWPAFLLNLIWLISNGLWLGGILVFILVGGGLLVFAESVQESPLAASVIVFVAEFALLLFLGFRGNDWLAAHLESRGYEQVQALEAKGFVEALELATSDHDDT